MKEPISISPDISQLLKRQTVAGTEGESELTQAEKEALKAFHSSTENDTDTIIPENINDLLKKQTNAGMPGYPDLTEDDRQTLKEYYSKHNG